MQPANDLDRRVPSPSPPLDVPCPEESHAYRLVFSLNHWSSHINSYLCVSACIYRAQQIRYESCFGLVSCFGSRLTLLCFTSLNKAIQIKQRPTSVKSCCLPLSVFTPHAKIILNYRKI